MEKLQIIHDYCRQFKLSGMAGYFEEALLDAQTNQISYTDYMIKLFGKEAELRDVKSTERRLKTAKLPLNHDLGQYDHTVDNGVNKTKRNIIIYGALAVFFIIMRPIVKMQVDSYFGAEFSTVAKDVSSIGDGILRLFWVMLAGAPEPIFPFLGTCFVGCMIGIYLAQEKPSKDVIRYGYISGFLLIMAGSILLILSDEPFSFIFSIMPLYLYLFHLGMQIIIMFFALSIAEFRPKLPVKFVTRTTFIRRWGILSLTVYFFQIFDIITREMLFGITGLPFNEPNQVGVGWGLLMVVVTMLFWEIILRVWEKIKYKGSLEFIIKKIGVLFGGKPDPVDPLSVSGILYEELEPISFTDPNIENFKLPSS